MIEIVGFIMVLVAMSDEAKKRGRDPAGFLLLTGAGYTLLLFANLGGPGLIFRWIWVAVCWAIVVSGNAGNTVAEISWQCPDCRLYNEPSTLRCHCGFVYDTAAPQAAASEPAP